MLKNPKHYSDLIKTALAEKKMSHSPRLIEGYMRLAYRDLEGLTLDEIKEEVAFCARLLDEDGAEIAEKNAQTFDLQPMIYIAIIVMAGLCTIYNEPKWKYDWEVYMIKKDFKLIAYLLSVGKANDTLINLFAITLNQHYPNFDREKFKQACTVVRYK